MYILKPGDIARVETFDGWIKCRLLRRLRNTCVVMLLETGDECEEASSYKRGDIVPVNKSWIRPIGITERYEIAEGMEPSFAVALELLGDEQLAAELIYGDSSDAQV
jgi:hypothetical protein